MIDDVKEAEELVKKMKAELPIFAYPTKRMRMSMHDRNNIKLKPKSLLKINDVLYLGDEGGIGCAIAFNNSKEVLIVSLTHLHIKERQPLIKEIKVYQFTRKRALAAQANS